ncbi:hypothetical protein FHS57_004753 [Runella defluvii]|uniref:Uncharacterized protein n=1 Tax=Runella defluvii TaxID=370973 RepID=A0A7W6ESK5_9BACT|nr:hypothetical protein [Runella defluvii]
MHCFLQIIGTIYRGESPYEMTLPISDIRRIIKNKNGKAIIRTIAITQEAIYTEHNYDDFIESLASFQKVEVIEILIN